jgi:diguanylate cyclase (GGDEF)-like protein
VLAERVRSSIEQLAFPEIAEDLRVTVSIGVPNSAPANRSGRWWRAPTRRCTWQAGGRNRIISLRPASAGDAARQGRAAPAQAAQSDPLTGVLNRRMLRDRLGHAIERAVRNGRLVALMLLNVNKFKEINDELGYEAGDAILVQTAASVRVCLRDSDTIARWGGDEFVVILEDVSLESDAQTVAEKILNKFAMPLAVNERECFVTLSVGIAMSPGVQCDADALLKRADIAMVRAKSWGDNIVQVYSAEASLPPSERLALKNGLREASAPASCSSNTSRRSSWRPSAWSASRR